MGDRKATAMECSPTIGWRECIMREIPLIAHVKHVSSVSAASAVALAGAQRTDMAPWIVAGSWLIAIAILHVALLDWLYRDAKRDARDREYRREQEEHRREADEARAADRKRIQELEDIVRRNGLT